MTKETLPPIEKISPSFIFGTLLLGALVRIGALLEIRHRAVHLLQPVLDAESYLNWAKEIATGDFWGKEVFFQSPLYPYTMGIFFKLFGVQLTLWIFLQFGFSLLTAYFTYRVAKKYYGQMTALVSALLLTTYAPLIFYDLLLLKTSFSLCLTMFFIFLLETKSVARLQFRWFFFTGLALGIACLARELLVLFIPISIGYLFLQHRHQPVKKAFAPLFGFLIGTALPLGTSAVRNYVVGGDLVLITAHGGANLYVGNNPVSDGTARRPRYMGLRSTPRYERRDFHRQAERLAGEKLKPSEVSKFWFQQSLRYMVDRPWYSLRHFGRKWLLFWNQTEIPDNYNLLAFKKNSFILTLLFFGFGGLFSFATLGITSSWTRRKEFIFLWTFLGVTALVYSAFHVNSRYRILVVPILTIFSAHGFMTWLGYVRLRKTKMILGSLALIGFTGMISYLPLYQVNQSEDLFRTAILQLRANHTTEAEEALQQTVEENPRHAAAWGTLGFLALQENQPEKALPFLDRAWELEPNEPIILTNRGSALARLKRYQAAEEMYQKALFLDPESFTARRDLALLFAKQRRFPEAEETLRPIKKRAIELYRQIERAKE